MRRAFRETLSLALVPLLIGSVVVGAELGTSGADRTGRSSQPIPCDGYWISQSNCPADIGDTQFACEFQNWYTTENWYGRFFLLAEDFGFSGDVAISKVLFGVSEYTGGDGASPPPPPAGDYTVDVVLYVLPNTLWPLPPIHELSEVARCPVTIAANDVGNFLFCEFEDVTIDPLTSNLVVAIDAPHGQDYHGQGLNVRFYPATNDCGATMDAYFASGSCDIAHPTPVGDIGLTNSQTLLDLCFDILAPPSGACCHRFLPPWGGYGCVLTHKWDCYNNHCGRWMGEGVECSVELCLNLGACLTYDDFYNEHGFPWFEVDGCTTGIGKGRLPACHHNYDQEECEDSGGIWGGAGLTCGDVGACCMGDGSCQYGAESACIDVGGNWLGLETICLPNPCEPYQAKESSWGAVKSTFR